MLKLILLRRTCKEAAALVISKEDRDLKLKDAVALRLHMMACKDCPDFKNEALTVCAAMGKWHNYLAIEDTKS